MIASITILFLAMGSALSLEIVASGRSFTFINSCDGLIRVDYVGGATNYTCGDGCPAGTQCNPLNGVCFFALPGTSVETPFLLVPPTQSIQVFFNYPCLHVNNGQFIFSGVIYASTGCNATGYDCVTGFLGPATRAEMTLQCVGTDFYDISLINGVNVGIAMAPIPPFANVSMDQDYYCKTPGYPSPQGRNPGCSWEFTPPSNTYALISSSANQTCTDDSDCSGTEVCGTAMVVVDGHLPTNNLVNVCGEPVGWWTDDEICVWTAGINYGNCKQGVPGGIGIFNQLFGCDGPYGNSCYQPGATDECCGCSNWTTLGVISPQPCLNTNPQWDQYILPAISFLKAACPIAYTFPYDDMTSTFQCSNDLSNNQLSYSFEFCPQNN